MQTDDLIARLSKDVTPVRRGKVPSLLGLGLMAGMAVTAGLLYLTLKLRPNLSTTIQGSTFWIKFAYTSALTLLGFWLVERQARAGADSRAPLWLLLAPLAALTALAVQQVMTPGADAHRLMMGHTARVCSPLILMLSLPIFAALLLTMRRLAPTRLTLAGASAGLLAGSASATIYGFHCPETAAPFILVWYTLGIALATGLGALTGRWGLKW